MYISLHFAILNKNIILERNNEIIYEAVTIINSKIKKQILKLKDKRFAVNYFTNLSGKETDEGRRISGKLLSKMIALNGPGFC